MMSPCATDWPNVRVLDCTIRDGGLCNDHQFTDAVVRGVYHACVEAGVDCMEIGYRASRKLFATGKDGDWRFCEEEVLRRIVGDNPTPLKLSVMADTGKCDWRHDIVPKSKSVIDVVRVAFYAYQVDEALEIIQHAKEQGYEVSANLMAVSTVPEVQLDPALEKLAGSPADVIVVVDSNGALYPDCTARLVDKYLGYARPSGKAVGVHTHNNLQLAFANSIEAMRHGATRIDATMAGMGRGAGNCPMELLLGFLRGPRYRQRPVLKLLQEHFVALRQQIDWGPSVPYNITGQLNQHPRAAIACRAGDDADHYVEFYDHCMAETVKA